MPGAGPGAPALTARARAVQRQVETARALDTELMAGRFDAIPARVIAIVDRLLALRDQLDRSPASDLAAVSHPGSPLFGTIEDVAPFGNVDLWRAKRSAAAAHGRQGVRHRPPRPHGGPPPPAAPVPPGAPAPAPRPGATGTNQAADRIMRDINRPQDQTLGRVGDVVGTVTAALDAIAFGTGFDVVEAGIATVAGEAVAVVAAPVLGALLGDALLLVSMEVAWRDTQRGYQAAGARFALCVLDEPWSPYPLVLRGSHVASRVGSSPSGPDLHRMLTAAYEGNRDGGPLAIARAGMDRVCQVVQRTVANAEARPQVVSAYARAASPAVKKALQQALRRDIYRAIFTRAAQPRAH